VAQGKYSCFKTPSDYTKLAKTLVQRDASEEGIDVLNSALKVFPENNDARLQVSITESYVYKKMHKDAEANEAMSEAKKIIADFAGKIPAELQLDLARAYLITGEKEKGTEIMKHVVEGNHDNEEMLDDVRTVFRETGMEDIGRKIIEDTKEEIIKLNNEGVKLAQDGRMAEAITYFEKAAAQLPENKIINANAAHILLIFMKEKGTTERYLKDVKTYLDRVRKIDEGYPDIPLLLSMYNELVPEG
jgi:tetratricopeptide (TPR) repeat protein